MFWSRLATLAMLCALSTCKARVSNNSSDLYSLHEIDAMYAHIGTTDTKDVDWRNNIDFVIPSSMGSAPSEQIERTRTDDHSLYWVLVSISKNAPWVRNIYILVDETPEWPYILPTNINVMLVNRCDYMQHCPTQRSTRVASLCAKTMWCI